MREFNAARAVAVVALVAAALATSAAADRTERAAGACVDSAQPAWIDYADKWVPFRQLFFRPGFAVAMAHKGPAADALRRGAAVAYWDMSLRSAVGTPSRPASPARISATAARLAHAAGKVTTCAAPIVALNELFGSQLRAPWSSTNWRYRDNVLTLVRELAARGTRPHLLISQPAAVGGAAGNWWRALAASATIVREVYISAPALSRLGTSAESLYLRFQLRRAIRNFTTIGIPSSQVGIALGFHAGRGGRAGLSRTDWFGVVKQEALAARRVGSELGIGSIWSWGWANFTQRRADDASADAACVYLWARDPALCNAQAATGGFNASRAQPAEAPASARLRLLTRGHPVWLEARATAKLTGRVASVQEQTATGWRGIASLNLAPFHPHRLRVSLPSGTHTLRLRVAPESAPGGEAITTLPVTFRVR